MFSLPACPEWQALSTQDVSSATPVVGVEERLASESG